MEPQPKPIHAKVAKDAKGTGCLSQILLLGSAVLIFLNCNSTHVFLAVKFFSCCDDFLAFLLVLDVFLRIRKPALS